MKDEKLASRKCTPINLQVIVAGNKKARTWFLTQFSNFKEKALTCHCQCSNKQLLRVRSNCHEHLGCHSFMILQMTNLLTLRKILWYCIHGSIGEDKRSGPSTTFDKQLQGTLTDFYMTWPWYPTSSALHTSAPHLGNDSTTCKLVFTNQNLLRTQRF